MEIKELMLYIFGTVIVVVLVHGFWVAWRKNQQRLRFDFVDGVSEAFVDEIDLLKGELPNGGARLVDTANGHSQENNERVEPEMKKMEQVTVCARFLTHFQLKENISTSSKSCISSEKKNLILQYNWK